MREITIVVNSRAEQQIHSISVLDADSRIIGRVQEIEIRIDCTKPFPYGKYRQTLYEDDGTRWGKTKTEWIEGEGFQPVHRWFHCDVIRIEDISSLSKCMTQEDMVEISS